MLKTITTKEHFNKYKDIIENVPEYELKDLVNYLYNDLDDLMSKFKTDKHLNNIKINLIYVKFNQIKKLCFKNKTSWSLAEGCCTIKHILIYIVLKVNPIFEEDIKDYKKIHKEYLEEKNYIKYSNEDDFFRFKKII